VSLCLVAAQCDYAECHYVQCRYAVCRYAGNVMLIVVMLRFNMLNVVQNLTHFSIGKVLYNYNFHFRNFARK